MEFTLILVQKSIDSSKLKEFAHDNLKYNENGPGTFPKGRNTMEKEEIAHNEQFLLFPKCFVKDLYCRYVKTRDFRGMLNRFISIVMNCVAPVHHVRRPAWFNVNV